MDTAKMDTPNIPILEGKQIPECPPNFMVAMKVQCQDGTVYAAGYNKDHHPNGVPQFALTFRRISLKRAEQRRQDKFNKALAEGRIQIPSKLKDMYARFEKEGDIPERWK